MMVLHKIDPQQHCLWHTEQYYFSAVWCAGVVNRKMCKLLNLVAIGLLKQGLLYRCLKKLYYFYLWMLNVCVPDNIFALELFIRSIFEEGGNGQMSIIKGLHLVVRKRYEENECCEGKQMQRQQCVCVCFLQQLYLKERE